MYAVSEFQHPPQKVESSPIHSQERECSKECWTQEPLGESVGQHVICLDSRYLDAVLANCVIDKEESLVQVPHPFMRFVVKHNLDRGLVAAENCFVKLANQLP
ncbi:hypothetical protein O181_107098 [Austropuccinia psidii MF-1]|uniref:Uncharacterized protein n=1 Tax=Austropuccinia psidii MF-1 TaxID=1389203 RepID=A0A9Q3JQ71_9BASI|nr:hypothetical protein [Austropuccinia psidii MF-1]